MKELYKKWLLELAASDIKLETFVFNHGVRGLLASFEDWLIENGHVNK